MRNKARVAAMAAAMLCALLPGLKEAAANRVLEPPKAHSIPAPEARVDINHASLEELLKVPGMTRSWAARIVRFRPYHAKNDLLDRGIVSSQVYDRIKDYVIAHRDSQ
jgi:competence protein ComEA